jgi:hypothetical protein
VHIRTTNFTFLFLRITFALTLVLIDPMCRRGCTGLGWSLEPPKRSPQSVIIQEQAKGETSCSPGDQSPVFVSLLYSLASFDCLVCAMPVHRPSTRPALSLSELWTQLSQSMMIDNELQDRQLG